LKVTCKGDSVWSLKEDTENGEGQTSRKRRGVEGPGWGKLGERVGINTKTRTYYS